MIENRNTEYSVGNMRFCGGRFLMPRFGDDEEAYWSDDDKVRRFDFHWTVHARRGVFPIELADLDCPICSGLPPWDWEAKYGYLEPMAAVDCKPWADRYAIKYEAFHWRTPRVWMYVDHYWGWCRGCGKFKKCARHDQRASAWRMRLKNNIANEDLDICRTCRRKEAKLSIEELIKAMPRGRRKNAISA